MRIILGTAAAVVLTLSTVSAGPAATSAEPSAAAAAGLSWKRVDLPHSHQSLRGLDAVDAEPRGSAASAGGVWRTTDGGGTWQDVSPADASGLLPSARMWRPWTALAAPEVRAISARGGRSSRILPHHLTAAPDLGDRRSSTTNPRAFYDCMAFFPGGRLGASR